MSDGDEGLEFWRCVYGLYNFVLPIISIIFSQSFPWKENLSRCDWRDQEWVCLGNEEFELQVRKCKCIQTFPVCMLVGFCLLLVYRTVTIRESFTTHGMYNHSKSYIFAKFSIGIPAFVVIITMWVLTFQSNSCCGKALWYYSVSLFIFACIQAAYIVYKHADDDE